MEVERAGRRLLGWGARRGRPGGWNNGPSWDLDIFTKESGRIY